MPTVISPNIRLAFIDTQRLWDYAHHELLCAHIASGNRYELQLHVPGLKKKLGNPKVGESFEQ